jgi:type III pantothenate kinase
MLLAIDVGNTNVVFALFGSAPAPGQPGPILTRWRIATDPRRTADQYAVWLMQLLQIEQIERDAIQRIVISTVVPRALHNLDVLATKYFHVEPFVAGVGKAVFGIDLDVDDPRTVGAARAVNAIGAHAKYKGDLIIVDFGTATTIDAVDFNGAYKGGIIAPGINLSLDALVGNTAKLPRIAIEQPAGTTVIGTNTEDQMLIGVYWGYVAMIEGLLSRMRAEIGRPATVVATGGMAALFNQQAGLFDVVDADLTLEGIALLGERAAMR